MSPDAITSGAHLAAAFARVQALPFERLGLGSEDPRLTELMGQFLADVRQWQDHLGVEDGNVFRSLARIIAPDLELPAYLDQWLNDLGESRQIYPSRGKYHLICGLAGYLHWAQLQDAGLVPEAGLADPYEPLLRFLELEGGIYVEHGIFMTIEPNGVGMILRRLSSQVTMPNE
jgi:hypothetical protein